MLAKKANLLKKYFFNFNFQNGVKRHNQTTFIRYTTTKTTTATTQKSKTTTTTVTTTTNSKQVKCFRRADSYTGFPRYSRTP